MDFTRSSLIFLLLAAVASPAAAADDLASKAEAAVVRHESFVAADNGARFLPAELRFGAKLSSPDIVATVEPAVNAIADFAEQMKTAGVKLLVVPVPPRIMQEAEALGVSVQEQQQMREGWQKILAAIASRSVDVIDLAPDFAASQENPFCVRDTHWSGPGIDITTAKLVPLLVEAGLAAQWPAGTDTLSEQSITGDLGGEPEKVKLRHQSVPNSPEEAKMNPVLLLGDSHLLVFHTGGDLHATGSGLPDQLAVALGSMPDVLGVRGSGATTSRISLARRVRGDQGYLTAKKIVVWCFAGREFTEADSWKKVPLKKANGS